jgi:Interleukin-like EMT inducer
LFKEASRVVMFPPYSWDFKRTNDFYPFCRAASLEGKAITTGYFARRHTALVNDYENKLHADWSLGNLAENDKAIFIGKKEKLWRLQKLVDSGQLQCFEYEGYAVLVPPVLKNTLTYLKQLPNCRPLAFQSENVTNFLEKNKNNTVFITVSEEATNKLDAETRLAFQKTGATEFAKLAYAGSYIGVLHKGHMLFEKVAGQGENIEKTWKIGEILNLNEIPTQSELRRNNIFFTFTKKLQLVSRGDVQNKMSKTIVGEKDYSPFHRGLNFVVVNDKFEVIESTYFDTYGETNHTIFHRNTDY